MKGDCYAVKDGDTADEVARIGTVRMHDLIDFCELCNCYRSSRAWQVMRSHGTPYSACYRHTPIDIALWESEL